MIPAPIMIPHSHYPTTPRHKEAAPVPSWQSSSVSSSPASPSHLSPSSPMIPSPIDESVDEWQWHAPVKPAATICSSSQSAAASNARASSIAGSNLNGMRASSKNNRAPSYHQPLHITAAPATATAAPTIAMTTSSLSSLSPTDPFNDSFMKMSDAATSAEAVAAHVPFVLNLPVSPLWLDDTCVMNAIDDNNNDTDYHDTEYHHTTALAHHQPIALLSTPQVLQPISTPKVVPLISKSLLYGNMSSSSLSITESPPAPTARRKKAPEASERIREELSDIRKQRRAAATAAAITMMSSSSSTSSPSLSSSSPSQPSTSSSTSSFHHTISPSAVVAAYTDIPSLPTHITAGIGTHPPSSSSSSSGASTALPMSPTSPSSPSSSTPMSQWAAIEADSKRPKRSGTMMSSSHGKSAHEEEHIGELGKEVEEGCVEFKWKLVGKTPERIQHLVTQMKWRLQEGGGQAIYELGVLDDGHPRGLADEELTESLQTIHTMAAELGCDVLVLRIAQGKVGRVAEVLVRKLSKETMDIRVCVIGNVDSGKSTLVGVLTTNELDNGRGMARTNVFRHRHELENGRTSAISRQIMGFDGEGKVTNGEGAFKDSGWQGIIERSAKIITFLDLAGHESYLKTTLFGLIGQIPDYGLVAVAANNGVLRMTKEHVGLALTLRIPLLVVVTKIDICPPHVLDQTVEQLEAILSRSDAGKQPVVVRSSKDVLPLVANKGLTANTLVPIFLVSSVTGKGLNALRMFLNLLPKRKDWSKYVDHPAEFAVDDSYSVEGVGTVVTGMLLKGSITTGDKLLLGPGAKGEFTEAVVKSVHVKRTAAKRAVAGQAASLALKKVSRAHIRKGMAMLHPSLEPRAVVGFDARVRVLNHPNGIQSNYEPVVHCGTIRQSARIVSTDPVDLVKTGEKATVRFNFIYRPEYLTVGSRIIFREGRTKGSGKIVRVYYYDDEARDRFAANSKPGGKRRSASKADKKLKGTGRKRVQGSEKGSSSSAEHKTNGNGNGNGEDTDIGSESDVNHHTGEKKHKAHDTNGTTESAATTMAASSSSSSSSMANGDSKRNGQSMFGKTSDTKAVRSLASFSPSLSASAAYHSANLPASLFKLDDNERKKTPPRAPSSRARNATTTAAVDEDSDRSDDDRPSPAAGHGAGLGAGVSITTSSSSSSVVPKAKDEQLFDEDDEDDGMFGSGGLSGFSGFGSMGSGPHSHTLGGSLMSAIPLTASSLYAARTIPSLSSSSFASSSLSSHSSTTISASSSSVSKSISSSFSSSPSLSSSSSMVSPSLPFAFSTAPFAPSTSAVSLPSQPFNSTLDMTTLQSMHGSLPASLPRRAGKAERLAAAAAAAAAASASLIASGGQPRASRKQRRRERNKQWAEKNGLDWVDDWTPEQRAKRKEAERLERNNGIEPLRMPRPEVLVVPVVHSLDTVAGRRKARRAERKRVAAEQEAAAAALLPPSSASNGNSNGEQHHDDDDDHDDHYDDNDVDVEEDMESKASSASPSPPPVHQSSSIMSNIDAAHAANDDDNDDNNDYDDTTDVKRAPDEGFDDDNDGNDDDEDDSLFGHVSSSKSHREKEALKAERQRIHAASVAAAAYNTRKR